MSELSMSKDGVIYLKGIEQVVVERGPYPYKYAGSIPCFFFVFDAFRWLKYHGHIGD